ncbi:MAG: class I SAM-dependent methyltransferase, partial [Gammaproteobacteria bacterium]|nr:class I SAM-dependent methyltransferase [Gammaproteobacteria bacterium]
MPEFYNRAIHRSQHRALEPWLRLPRGTRVLDVGCGTGRWSRRLAARGADVTGIDFSPTMIAMAGRLAGLEGVARKCRFAVQDLSAMEMGERFDVVLGVTVLQHILDPRALRAAVQRMAAH